MMNKIRDAAGIQAALLGFDVDLDIKPAKRSNATKRGYPTILLRMIMFGIAVAGWIVYEKEMSRFCRTIGSSAPIKTDLLDAGHTLFEPVR